MSRFCTQSKKKTFCYFRLTITVTRRQFKRECLGFNESQNTKETVNGNKRFYSPTLTYLECAFCGIWGKFIWKLPSKMSGYNRQCRRLEQVLNKCQLKQNNIFSIILFSEYTVIIFIDLCHRSISVSSIVPVIYCIKICPKNSSDKQNNLELSSPKCITVNGRQIIFVWNVFYDFSKD